MTASSDPVGLQARCFKGPSIPIAKAWVSVGSLKPHSPSVGLQRRFLSSSVRPLGEIDAILPHFDQAILLGIFRLAQTFTSRLKLTGSNLSLSVRQFSDVILWTGVLREVKGLLHRQKGHRYPSDRPSWVAFPQTRTQPSSLRTCSYRSTTSKHDWRIRESIYEKRWSASHPLFWNKNYFQKKNSKKRREMGYSCFLLYTLRITGDRRIILIALMTGAWRGEVRDGGSWECMLLSIVQPCCAALVQRVL